MAGKRGRKGKNGGGGELKLTNNKNICGMQSERRTQQMAFVVDVDVVVVVVVDGPSQLAIYYALFNSESHPAASFCCREPRSG